jgi:hypothetical protein
MPLLPELTARVRYRGYKDFAPPELVIRSHELGHSDHPRFSIPRLRDLAISAAETQASPRLLPAVALAVSNGRTPEG